MNESDKVIKSYGGSHMSMVSKEERRQGTNVS